MKNRDLYKHQYNAHTHQSNWWARGALPVLAFVCVLATPAAATPAWPRAEHRYRRQCALQRRHLDKLHDAVAPAACEDACAAKLEQQCNSRCTESAAVSCVSNCQSSCSTSCATSPPSVDCTTDCKSRCQAGCSSSCTSTTSPPSSSDGSASSSSSSSSTDCEASWRSVLQRPLQHAVCLGPIDRGLHDEVQRGLHRLVHGHGQLDLPGAVSGEQLRAVQVRAGEPVHHAVPGLRRRHLRQRQLCQRKRRRAMHPGAERRAHREDHRQRRFVMQR